MTNSTSTDGKFKAKFDPCVKYPIHVCGLTSEGWILNWPERCSMCSAYGHRHELGVWIVNIIRLTFPAVEGFSVHGGSPRLQINHWHGIIPLSMLGGPHVFSKSSGSLPINWNSRDRHNAPAVMAVKISYFPVCSGECAFVHHFSILKHTAAGRQLLGLGITEFIAHWQPLFISWSFCSNGCSSR